MDLPRLRRATLRSGFPRSVRRPGGEMRRGNRFGRTGVAVMTPELGGASPGALGSTERSPCSCRSCNMGGGHYGSVFPVAHGRTSLAAVQPWALWSLGLISTCLLAIYLGLLAHQSLMDFLVYRMGGQHAFGHSLYSSKIIVDGRPLLFTYPPAAALLFWPLTHVSTLASQTIWNSLNLAALCALITLSIAGAQARRPVPADWRTSFILLGPVGLLLYPVWVGLALGQINVILTLMIVADLTIGVSCRGRSLPRGVLVGLAAAIKLTPLVFLPYLAITRQWRTARNALFTFSALTGVMFVLNPSGSSLYFTKDAIDVKRIGNIMLLGNQSLRSALDRGGLTLSDVHVDLLCFVFLGAGIALAAVAYRQSSVFLSLLICAATGLMLSPVSWTHHYVWVVPVFIWLVSGVDRPMHGVFWAVAAAVPFIVGLPFTSSGSGAIWYVRSNAYVVATLVFMALTATMLFTRHRSRSRCRSPVRVDP